MSVLAGFLALEFGRDKKTPLNPKSIGILVGSALVFTIVLAIIYSTSKVNQDNFHFEVTPEKRCDGGEYLHQSGPTAEYCKKLLSSPEGIREFSEYSCLNPAFVGRPVHFEYTPESDAEWQDPRCNPPILQKDRPQVL